MPKSAQREPNGDEAAPMRPPPARTRARRINQLVRQAENLIEERLINGTASPTEVVAVMRYGSEIERANVDRIKAHTEYLVAQKAKAESETVREQLFTEAIAAMQRYSPSED